MPVRFPRTWICGVTIVAMMERSRNAVVTRVCDGKSYGLEHVPIGSGGDQTIAPAWRTSRRTRRYGQIDVIYFRLRRSPGIDLSTSPALCGQGVVIYLNVQHDPITISL